jgi:C1A family cysteine protease
MTIATDYGMGWRREPPDYRDLTFDTHDVQFILRISTPFKAANAPNAVLPASVDLRKWCTRAREMGKLGASTAFAVTGLIEYFERRAFGKQGDLSELFLYRATRDLLGTSGDSGADLRTTLRALRTFGVPAESLYPYVPARFDDPAPAYCYSFSEPFRSMRYFRLDAPNLVGKEVLLNVRKCLAARMPSIFGVSVFSSFPLPGETVDISFPTPGEERLGGLALVAVGYDDERMIGGDQGALLVRNAWGSGWGEGGYAWLSYKFVTERLAVDFWSLVRPDFVNTDLFN